MPIIAELEGLFKKLILLESNHGSLVARKAKTAGISRSYLKPLNDVYGTKLWTWAHRVTGALGGKPFVSAHRFQADVLNASKKKGLCTIQGHFHTKFEIRYSADRDRNTSVFGATIGCLIDDMSPAFAYNKTNADDIVLGALVTIGDHPILVPMELDRSGRWTGDFRI